MTLTLHQFGSNLFSMDMSYDRKLSEEPCIIDSRCLTVASNKNAIEQPKRSANFKMPTVMECLAILTSLGRQSCLDLIEREKNRPLSRNETRQKLIKSAFSYDEDPKDSVVRNLYGTELQYRCPFGQKFILDDMNKDDLLSKEEILKLNDVHDITCLWNQTWDKLYENETMLPACIRMYLKNSSINLLFLPIV